MYINKISTIEKISAQSELASFYAKGEKKKKKKTDTS